MLNLNLSDFMVEFKEGSVKNVGPTTKEVTAKLFDVESVEAREFGDSQVKVVAEDDEGNEIQIALFPEQVEVLAEDIEELRNESRVFED
jgi:hypothetical protein